MKMAICELSSVSPYSQSRHYTTPRKEKEDPSAYEERTWRDRAHVDEDGYVFIPPSQFMNCVKEAAKYLSIKIAGEGNAKWTKHFEAGILCTEGVTLPLKKEDLEGEWIFVPSDGRPGGGKRVDKCFPIIRKWHGTVTFYILDDKITKDVFLRVLKESGNLIGLGRFRPRNRGFYGRFKVDAMEWKEMTA